MIEISNLRKHAKGDAVRLEARIKFLDMTSPYPEKTIYFELDKKYAHMFADDSYDAFILIPLWLAMLHKQDLHICGAVSKKLYHNVKWYVQKIFCDFCDALTPVNVTVDNFTDPPKKYGKIIGTGISGGVDSLSTIQDHFVNERDTNFKINALFYFNCGTHSDFGDEKWQETVSNRLVSAKLAAKELGLPCYYLNTNLHAFRKMQDWTKVLYIANYSCVLSLSRAISSYYVPSGFNYQQMKKFGNRFRNNDMAEFCESYLVPLIGNERTELILDGGQYRRVDKLKKIVDWDIAKKYLNVCNRYTADGSNCGACDKCLMTLLPLEIMGKLDDYAGVFDVEEYRTKAKDYKRQCVEKYGKAPFSTENIDFAKESNFIIGNRD